MINKVISVDQSPLGNTPNSTPATYAGAFDLIRELFAKLPEAKVRGYSARRFSFNQAGGRCEACDGAGQKRIEMHFLPDVWITCDACGGARYTAETLAVKFHGKTIADVLNHLGAAALELFANVPQDPADLEDARRRGAGLHLARPGRRPTLSGGEAQRVKLAAELARPDTGKTLYILDEPTTGLHFDDVRKLLGRDPPAGRPGQHGGRDRAQPRGDQDGRLGHRSWAGGRDGRRRPGRRGHARRDRQDSAEPYGKVPRAGAGGWTARKAGVTFARGRNRKAARETSKTGRNADDQSKPARSCRPLGTTEHGARKKKAGRSNQPGELEVTANRRSVHVDGDAKAPVGN